MIRDLFVFCCYTGLTYVEVINLTHDNIVEASDGEVWIRTNRQKTETPVTTPLLPKAIKILKKYKHDPRAARSEEHTSEHQSLMLISYAVFSLKNISTLLIATSH